MRRLWTQLPALTEQIKALAANRTTNKGTVRDHIVSERRRQKFISDWGFAVRREGPSVDGLAEVILVVVLGRVDIDATEKVLLDASERLLFTGGSDGAVRVKATVLRRPGKGASRGPNRRPALPPSIVVEAFPLGSEDYLSRLGMWREWARARYGWLTNEGEPRWYVQEEAA